MGTIMASPANRHLIQAMQAEQSGFPPIDPDDAHLVQITDTHLSAVPDTRLRGIDPAHTLAAVFELATPWLDTADHILLTGDLTHDGRIEGADHLRSLLDPFGKPFSFLPGNHDNPTTLERALGDRPACWPWQVQIKEWDLISLNSSIPGREGGELGGAQRERLAELLGTDTSRPTLIALHHHPTPVGSPWMDAMGLADGDALLELLQRHPQVRGVLFGHVHQLFDTRIGCLRVLGTPSTCMQFKPNSHSSRSDQRLPGFRWLILGADGTIETGVERLKAWPDNIAPTP